MQPLYQVCVCSVLETNVSGVYSMCAFIVCVCSVCGRSLNECNQVCVVVYLKRMEGVCIVCVGV